MSSRRGPERQVNRTPGTGSRAGTSRLAIAWSSVSEPRQPGKPTDVIRLYTDMPVFELGSKHPAAGGPEQPADEIGWDRNESATTFVSLHADPAEARARARKALVDEGWALASPAAGADPETTQAATRTMSRAAQLKPADESARRLLGYWSLKDTYPPGIARGGCIMANYDYEITVTIRPAEAYADAELSAVVNPGAVGGCQIDVRCNEVITPFRGKFPDPRRFSVASELARVDPVAALKQALGEQ